MIPRTIASLVILIGLAVSQAEAYGKKGHAMVGAIADQRLAGKAVATKIANLLDGMKLADAALLADEIKAWDKHPMDDPSKNPDTFHLPDHPLIEKDLLAFWMANPGVDKSRPSHHVFHYSDVPIADNVTYSSGKVGRSQFDVVKMIPFCARVLLGKEAEDNERKITRRLAVLLLAHYLGDIHQPLHVGAQYFNDKGEPVNPDAGGLAFADQGGNKLQLILQRPGDHGHANASYIFHSYWDDQTVDTAFGMVRKEIRTDRPASKGQIDESDIARRLAAQEPAKWKLPDMDNIDQLSIAWADEILPIARQAHQRLDFANIKIHKAQGKAESFAAGNAIEKMQQPDGVAYHDWAGQVVREKLHVAGWRLAALLEGLLQ